MNRECISAFTAATDKAYPPYISVNVTDADTVAITVRSPAGLDGSCGACATIPMRAAEFAALIRECSQHVVTAER